VRRDARWEHQLPLTEPGRRTAIHGLACWVPWQLVQHERSSVVVQVRLHPQPGYPFDLEVRVAYELDADLGLTVRTTASNVGDSALPYATGQHPYLSPGTGATVDDAVLSLPARVRIRTDSRGLPLPDVEPEPVEPELRAGRPVGDLVLDDTFADLARDADGRAWTRLRGRDGVEVGLWQDESYGWLEVFTGDTLGVGRRRTGLGVEPMTAPPDGFGSGDGLTVLGPGETATSTWGVRLL
jgi:aldose 1-epimerase